MSKRLTAKEIKHDIREDEVRTFLSRIFLALEEHPNVVAGVLGGIVAVAILGSTTYAFLNNRQAAAHERLADAIKVHTAPIAETDAQPDDPREPSFASAEERRERAQQALEDVGGIGAGAAAEIADLLAADLAIEDGDTETARTIWEKFLAGNKDHLLAMSVRLNLIHLDRAEGKAEEVAAELEQELEDPSKRLPEDVILFELAQTREALGETEGALELYQRILDEHPTSPYTAPARQVVTTSEGS